MNENAKTICFLAVAVLVVAAAVVTSLPPSSADSAGDLVGKPLFPEFKDPLAVTSLEIDEFDEDTATLQRFLVQQTEVKGKTRWVIPSHDNYPADAKEQVASAATSLMGLKVVSVVGDDQGDQRIYGVIAPDPKVLKVGTTGVGAKIVMRDKDGKEVLALILGKEVPDRPGLRYVRKPGQDPICIVEAKADKFSTKFENWIERNLLSISSFDVKRLWIRDYAIKPTSDGLAILQNGEMRIERNDAGDAKWKMTEDRKYVVDEQKWVSVPMGADEELNAARLDEMMTALDDLKIVDVSRKPAALSADLKANPNFASQDPSAAQSLAEKGFFLARLEGDRAELFSNEGETRITANDGVEYVLRFGDIAGAGSTKKEDKEKAKGKDDKKSSSVGLNRYLFIMAEFNSGIVPQPALEPLPEPAKEPDGGKSSSSAAADDANAPEKKTDEKKTKETAENKKDDSKNLEAEQKAREEERARIEKENKRKQEEYDQRIADGKKRVEELNARFADWYYIISDEVYHKIHLTRSDLVKKKDKTKAQDKQLPSDHADHDHAGEPQDTTTPIDELEKLKNTGPDAK